MQSKKHATEPTYAASMALGLYSNATDMEETDIEPMITGMIVALLGLARDEGANPHRILRVARERFAGDVSGAGGGT